MRSGNGLAVALATVLGVTPLLARAATTTTTVPVDPSAEARALVQASALRAMKQNWAGAEEAARAAIVLDRTLADAWHHLGLALAKQGRPDDAIAAWEEALLRDPDHVVALERLGRLYASLGRRRKATALLERLAPLDDRRAATLHHAIELSRAPNAAER